MDLLEDLVDIDLERLFSLLDLLAWLASSGLVFKVSELRLHFKSTFRCKLSLIIFQLKSSSITQNELRLLIPHNLCVCKNIHTKDYSP